MAMRKIFIVLLIGLTFSMSARAGKYYRFEYVVERLDSFSRIIWKFCKHGHYIYNSDPMIKRIQRYNKHVKNWEKLRAGTKLVLFIDLKYAKLTAIKDYMDDQKGEEAKPAMAMSEQKKKLIFKKRYILSGFYTVSRGTFEESVKNNQTTTTQNSPISLGIAGTYFTDFKHSFSGSVYLSYLVGGLLATGESVDPPMEYGLNAYYNYKLFDMGFSVYGGLDHEHFSTYNTDELADDVPLAIREHQMSFVTAGISSPFNLLGRKFFMKASLSLTVRSSSSPKSTLTSREFKGKKYILYLNTPLYKKVLGHFLFKKHILNGPTRLKVSRFGIGFGYKFF